jgi:O-antigen/teichoic acid export membrane protein
MDQAWLRYLPEFIRVKFVGRQNLQKVVGNTWWLYANTILRAPIGIAVNVWLARYLGPKQFGLFNYVIAFVALFSAFSTLGLDGFVVRDIVRDPDTRDETLGSAFVLKFCGGVVTLLVSLGVIMLIKRDDAVVWGLVAITAAGALFQAFDTIDLWFQSQVLSKYTIIARSIPFLLVSAAKVILILMKAPLVAFVWAGLAELVLAAIGLTMVYHSQKYLISAWTATVARAKSLLKDSWPLIFSTLVGMVYLRIDQVMLSQMVGDRELGIYSAAVKLAEAWYFLLMLANSVVPHIVEAKAVSDDMFYDRLQRLYNAMAFMGYAVAIPTTFLGGWVVRILYGEAYSSAGPMLVVLIWGLLFVLLGVARSIFLTTMNWGKVHLYTVFLGAVVNVLLNLLLIPRYGGMGAAIASCIAYWVATHGSCFFYRPLFKTGNMLTKALIYPKVW